MVQVSLRQEGAGGEAERRLWRAGASGKLNKTLKKNKNKAALVRFLGKILKHFSKEEGPHAAPF